MSSRFVDDEGVVWTIHRGLPADYPDVGEARDDAGLTFRSATGETRVIARAAISRMGRAVVMPSAIGEKRPVNTPADLDWKDLLGRALRWPIGA